MLGRQITTLSHLPSSIIELKRALQEAWNRLSPQLIHHLIASMIDSMLATHPEQWLVTLTAAPLDVGSNPGEVMDVCKYVLLLWLMRPVGRSQNEANEINCGKG
ncbi:hypothetical protein TNCV_1933091 [Trichonephila clavipes]|nr:hypothetical protein TNCV_1933091 [Trichonephila clavipes]